MSQSVHLLLNLCFCFLNSLPFAIPDSNYENFANCLAKNPSIPSDQISKIIYSRTNFSFTSVLDSYVRNRRFNASSTPKPLLIVTPLAPNQVQATVLCAKILKFQLKIRSGGHDYEGLSYVSNEMNFIILDMFNLRSIRFDIGNEAAWVESGATLGELYYRIWENSKIHAFPAGICPTVGIGGHISGGGYGVLLRKFGLSVDNLIDAQIVDVNGRILDRTAMGEDLFWAISGGGGASFGVILAYKIKLVRVPDLVTVFRIEKDEEQQQETIDIVYKWQEIADRVDNDLFVRLLLQPIKEEKTVKATFIGMFLGDSNRLIAIMNDQFLELGLKKNDCFEMGWAESVLWWFKPGTTTMEELLNRVPDLDSVNFLKRKSDYVQKPITKTGLETLFKKLIELGKTGVVFNPYGGRMGEIAETEKPFPHRSGIVYKIQYSVNWEEDDANVEKEYMAEIRELHDFMTPFVSKNPRQAFLNYRDLDIGTSTTSYNNGKNGYDEGKVYGIKYFKGNFDRLVKVKTMVDPENFFRNEQSIPTLPAAGGGLGGGKERSEGRQLGGLLLGLVLALHQCIITFLT
ncbi:hypothetical protein M9H77_11402 [Catharanthus roseus]|uniref:Uncharacterized protein n=1 Tax=Catharanthus roseus TaxID=4058 RepID=A0ACC0BEJ0_CATRO|nr:hypothetical protein M9H77_11402 [Catharanthus roseus]